MSASNPWHLHRQLHRAGDNAAPHLSLPRQPAGDAARTPAISGPWERCGLTSQELAAVRDIYRRFDSTPPFELRRDQDPWAAFYSSSFPSHSEDEWTDDPPPSRVQLWIRAACLLLVGTSVLAGWVWLVRHLLAT